MRERLLWVDSCLLAEGIIALRPTAQVMRSNKPVRESEGRLVSVRYFLLILPPALAYPCELLNISLIFQPSSRPQLLL